MTVLITRTYSSPLTRYELEGDLVSQSISGNYSVVRMYLACYNAGDSTSRWLNPGVQAGRVNGTEFGRREGNPFLPGGYSNGATRWRLGPYDVKVPHKADGTGPKGLGGGAWGVEVQMHVVANVADSVIADIVLPTIPRASTPSFAGGSTFEAGKPVTINTNRASSSFTHRLTLVFGSIVQTLTTTAGDSFQWTPPLDLLAQFPNATSMTGRIQTATFSGSTQIGGDTQTAFTLTAPASAKPTVTGVTVSDANPDVASIVGKLVQGLSRARFVVAAQGFQGSTITDTETLFLGQRLAPGMDALITQAGSVPVVAFATDSRGRTGELSATLTALAYAQPSVSAYQARRSTSAGVIADDGAYLRVDLTGKITSLVNSTERNALTIRAFTRPRATTGNPVQPWTARNVITPGGMTYNSWFLVSGGGVFATTAAYDVRVQVHDKFGVYVADTVVSTAKVALDLNGINVGVGKIWQQGALDVGGQIFQDGLPVIDSGDVATESTAGVIELATQAEVNAGTDNTRAVTPASLRGDANLPWAMAAGEATITVSPASAQGSVTISFPAGKFTVPPHVFVMKKSGSMAKYIPYIASLSSTSVTIGIYSGDGSASSGSVPITWQAVQMTAGSASG